MPETILLVRQGQILEATRKQWERHLAEGAQHAKSRLSFMTEEHHRIRNWVVRELPRLGKPIPPQAIAQALDLPVEQVTALLDELEKKLFFLVRNGQGAVAWAYPVTVEPTPHRLTFNSGERLYGACAEDAIATPFVQGQLRRETLAVTIDTQCAHCDRPMQITIASDMNIKVRDRNAEPLLFVPNIDWEHFREPNIIHAY